MAGPWEAYQADSTPSKPWEAYQAKPLPAKTDDDRAGEIPGVPRLSEIVKGGYEGLKDAFMAPGKVLSGEIKPGTPEAESAARNVASTIAGGMGGKGSKAKILPGSGPADKNAATAVGRMGVDINKTKSGFLPFRGADPDKVQSALQTGISQTKGDIAAARGVAPMASERELAEQVAKGIGDKRDQVKALEDARWEKAKTVGATIPVDGVSNIEDIRRMVGQIGQELKSTGGELAQDLKAQKLDGEGEILDLREKIHELEEANVAGEDVGEIKRAKMDKAAKSIEIARQQLAQKLKIQDNLEQRIAEAEKTEKAAAPSSVPTKIETAADLIQLRQHLNSADPEKMSPVELAKWKDDKAAVDKALSELGDAKPDPKLLSRSNMPFLKNATKEGLDKAEPSSPNNFGDLLRKANRRSEINAERYGGDAARELGVDKAFIAAEKKTGRPLVGKDAITNAITSTYGIVDRIQNTAHIDWLRANMRPQAFNQLMANKLAKTLDEVGWSGTALKEKREFLDYIVKDGVGLKGNKIGQKLDDLQTVLDKTEAAGVTGKMRAKAYRGKDPDVARALNAAKASASLLTSAHGVPVYGVAKGAEAVVGGGGAAEAKAYQALQKNLKQRAPKYIPGEAIGAAIGGGANYQDQK